MKGEELRKKTVEELEAALLELRREQFDLRMQAGMGQLSKPDQVRKLRRNVARIKTVLNEKAK